MGQQRGNLAAGLNDTTVGTASGASASGRRHASGCTAVQVAKNGRWYNGSDPDGKARELKKATAKGFDAEADPQLTAPPLAELPHQE